MIGGPLSPLKGTTSDYNHDAGSSGPPGPGHPCEAWVASMTAKGRPAAATYFKLKRTGITTVLAITG
jgi:hypothetical protein